MLYFVSIVGMIVVGIVLALGLTNMARGGSANRSQTFMRYRILFQFITIIVVMATLYFTTK